MRLITWNVQWCHGLDGSVDPARIAGTARQVADFDVLCLQEIARNFPGLEGSRGEDQLQALAAALPDHSAFFVAATDVDDGKGGRSEFGNLILTRLPVLQVYRRLLPWPADPPLPSMQRGAVEVVVSAAWGPLRVLTTHLEYYSQLQRAAQVEALRGLHAEACTHAQGHRPDADSPGSPFAPVPRPSSAVLCGDLNFEPGSSDYLRLLADFDDGAAALKDAWTLAHGGIPHSPTFRVFDPAGTAYCCDFVFVSADLAPRLRRVEVDLQTQASDHQPVLLELDDEISGTWVPARRP